jgi:leucine-zipper of insertion element IS481
MKLRRGANLSESRRLLVDRVLERVGRRGAVMAAGVSDRTAYRRLRRFRERNEAHLDDRCSASRRIPRETQERVKTIEALRRLRA